MFILCVCVCVCVCVHPTSLPIWTLWLTVIHLPHLPTSGDHHSNLCFYEFDCFRFHIQVRLCMEKAVAPHSSTLAWKIPWMEEPGRLRSMGSLRVGHDWATSLSLFTFIHWRRKWQPTPVFLPGESQGRGSLVGGHLWGRTESYMTEVTQQQQDYAIFFFLFLTYFT